MNTRAPLCLTLLIILLYQSQVHAQEFGNQAPSEFGNTPPTWFKRYGEDNWTSINAIQRDDDTLIVAGSLGSSRFLSDFSGMNWARENIHLMRLDLGGGVIWARTYAPKGVTNPTKAIDFDLDSDGDIVVIADVEPERTNTSGITDESSVIIMKLGEAGQEHWQREYPKNPEEKGVKIVAASDGSYMALLRVEGEQESSRLIKIDQNGNYIGESVFDGHFFDFSETQDGFVLLGHSRALQLDHSGRAVGEWPMEGTTGEFLSDNRVLFQRSQRIRGRRYMPTLTLSTTSGQTMWRKRYDFGGKRLSYFRTMSELEDGFLLSGSYQDDFGVNGKVFVMRITATGEPLWIRELTGSKAGTLANDLLIHPDGGFFLAGAIDWDILLSNDQQVMGAQSDAYVMRISPSGSNERLSETRTPDVSDLN